MTVTLNKDEILQRAYGFMREFSDAHYKMGEAQNFIRGLCEVFGFSNKRLVSFEQRVKKLGGKSGRIDGFYPGKLLIEMKSRGEDLDEAYRQATGYLPGLPDPELPEYCLVSDFENLHLYKLSAHAQPLKHKLPDFAKYIDSYLFLADYEPQAQKDQIAVDESAARKIAQLHDAMRAGGYVGEDLQRYLVCRRIPRRPVRPTDHAPGPAQGPPKTRHRRRRRLPTQRRQKDLRLRRRTRGLPVRAVSTHNQLAACASS